MASKLDERDSADNDNNNNDYGSANGGNDAHQRPQKIAHHPIEVSAATSVSPLCHLLPHAALVPAASVERGQRLEGIARGYYHWTQQRPLTTKSLGVRWTADRPMATAHPSGLNELALSPLFHSEPGAATLALRVLTLELYAHNRPGGMEARRGVIARQPTR